MEFSIFFVNYFAIDFIKLLFLVIIKYKYQLPPIASVPFCGIRNSPPYAVGSTCCSVQNVRKHQSCSLLQPIFTKFCYLYTEIIFQWTVQHKLGRILHHALFINCLIKLRHLRIPLLLISVSPNTEFHASFNALQKSSHHIAFDDLKMLSAILSPPFDILSRIGIRYSLTVIKLPYFDQIWSIFDHCDSSPLHYALRALQN